MSSSFISQEQTSLPLVPLRDMVVFPHMMAPFIVGRDASVAGTGLVAVFGRAGGLAGAVVTDAALTLQNNPLGGVALLVTISISALLPAAFLAGSVMPLALPALALLVAGVSTRERRAGTQEMVLSIAGLESRFVAWKLGVNLLFAGGFTGIAVLKLAVVMPATATSLVCGTLFVVGAATSLGILTATPRVFVVLFLSFWYVVINDGGNTTGLDFAGFYGARDPRVGLLYLALAAALVAIAYGADRWRGR